MANDDRELRVRLAAMADLHCTTTSGGWFRPLFASATLNADVLLLCGDLTDKGQPAEAQVLVHEITTAVDVPVVAVLGNHDYESDAQNEIAHLLGSAGVHVLDGSTFHVNDVGFAGVKGFCGGLKPHVLGAWGERVTKQFVYEAQNEARKLDAALARLETALRIVILHYSPVRDTLVGESPEIFCFLGSTHLEKTLNRHPIDVIIHGHAHAGQPEGRTKAGVPVYNVSMPLLRREFPQDLPYRLITLRRPRSSR